MSAQPVCTNPETGQLLGAYELGLLDAGDRTRLEDHLRACEACREDAYAAAPLATALSSNPAGILRRLAPARGTATLGAWLRRLAAGLAVPRVLVPASALAALALFLVLRPAGDPASLARVEPLPWVPLAVRDAGAEDADARFERAMATYAAGDVEAARPMLEAALATEPPLAGARRDQANLYLGVTRLLAGDVNDAVRPLGEAAASPLPVVADRGRWYLAQAHLKRGDGAAARPLLESLAAGSPGYSDAAAAQLRRLPAR